MNGAEQKKILVVDDQMENLLILEDLLDENYQVRTFASGEELLNYLASGEGGDLVLMDINMPGLSGFEACERLKANTTTAAIPVIFLSGLVTEEDRQYGLRIGGVHFLHKPFSFSDVLASVDKFTAGN